MALRNIQVGDNLSGKTLYFSFPESLSASNGYIVETGNSSYRIRIYYTQIRVYNGSIWTYTNVKSLASLTLSDNFGVVTAIDSTNEAYQYIRIDVEEVEDITDYYTVTFKNDDGTVLKTEQVVSGGSATAPSNPTKASTEQYTYTFAGWDGSYTSVTNDTVVTATYTSTIRSYTVTWVVDGASTIESYSYGATPTYSGSTDKPSDDEYNYTFTGWLPEVSTVTGNATYTAQYTATPISVETVAQITNSIKVYEADETLFDHNGLKILRPYKAIVYKEDNGDYYLEVEDSIDNLAYYQQGYIIRVPTPWGYQGFRVSNPIKKNRKITVKAWHLFYDSAKYVIEDSNVVDKSCNDALDHLNTACDQTTPFTTISDVAAIGSFRCVRKSFEEAISTVLEKWGGHLDRDNFEIGIREAIGQDRGVVLAYGKNIESIEAKENWDNVVTKILPVGYDGQLLDDIYLTSDISYDVPYTKVVEFKQDIKEEDYETTDEYIAALKTDLEAQATAYLEENKLPKVNYTLKAHLQNVADVGDSIWVKHPKCSIDIETNVISVKWDVIRQKYKEIEFGNFRNKLKNLVTDINKTITETVNREVEATEAKLTKELEEAKATIWGAMGNSYVIYDGDKILIVDTLPAEEAANCILINNGGIGFSTTGINGTFNSAWTIDGTLDMQQINVVNLVADMIKGGTLKLGSNLNESGILELYDDSNNLIALLDKTGITVYAIDGTYVKLNPEVGFAGYDKNGNKAYWADGIEFHMENAVIEKEITIAGEIRILSIDNGTNVGLAFVPMV